MCVATVIPEQKGHGTLETDSFMTSQQQVHVGQSFRKLLKKSLDQGDRRLLFFLLKIPYVFSSVLITVRTSFAYLEAARNSGIFAASEGRV